MSAGRRSARYWRKRHPNFVPDRRVARMLAELADVHPDWDDGQVIAYWNYTGEH